MSARQPIDRDGPLLLARTDGAFEMLWDGMFLMSSECRTSERLLGSFAEGRTLVAGLGMGFSLRAALEAGAESVVVVEISDAVVRWNRTLLGPLAGRPLDDPRVTVCVDDVSRFLADTPAPFDTILLDVDNGPSWTARNENDRIYTDAGIGLLKQALQEKGLLAVWSAHEEPGFLAQLGHEFESCCTVEVPARVGGRAFADYIYVARR